MSPDERDLVKTLIDQAVRAKVAAEDASFGGGCSGCGMPMTDWTPGCYQCSGRHGNWRKGRTQGDYDPLLHRTVLEHSAMLFLDAARTSNPTGASLHRARAAGKVPSWKHNRQAWGMTE